MTIIPYVNEILKIFAVKVFTIKDLYAILISVYPLHLKAAVPLTIGIYMKKIFKILAVTATAACLVGLAACSSSSGKLSLDSFWYIDTYPRIQNSAIGTREVLVYDVTLDADTQENTTYHINLDTEKDHTYTTIFGVGVYNWSNNTFVEITETNKSDYATANGVYAAGTNEEFVYYYKTELVYSGAYVYDSDITVAATADNSIAFDNTITTVSCFRSAQDNLEPVYSYTSAHSTVPNSNIPSSVSAMAQELEYEYTVYYSEDCTQATCTYANKLDSSTNYTKTVDVGSDNYTYFDNNQLYAAIRGMNLSSSFSETISLYIPADGGMVDVAVAGSSTAELDSVENATIVNALTAAYGESDLSGSEDEAFTATNHSYIEYTEVSIALTGDYTGVTRTACYTCVEDENNNQYRATLIYFTNPMSYNLGTLEYTLTEVQEVIAPDK